jgi:exopolysaccharide biosynthesis polyprenyl glycosylphosphotransferase
MDWLNFLRVTEKAGRRRGDDGLHMRKRTLITANQDLYDEHDFLKQLYLERRRSERSTRPLCLILLEGLSIADVYTRESAFQQVFDQLRASTRETDIIGWYKQSSTLAILFPDLTSADTVVLNKLQTKVCSAVSLALPSELVKHLRVSVHLFPRNNDLGTEATDLTFYPDIPSQYEARKAAHLLKRLIDISGSLLLLCLLAPLLLLIALVIKVNSKGPILFRQVRVGQHGNLFRFWKFRSMYIGNDASIHKEYVTNFISRGVPASQSEAVYKIRNDPRVTTVGRFLRKTSLDELPQLWNVLCGDMSLVGPRPPVPYEFECYALWHRRRIFEVKPGITGLWQVMGRSRISFNDMVRLDLKYVQYWSIWLDIRILLQTPKAVLMGEGAY